MESTGRLKPERMDWTLYERPVVSTLPPGRFPCGCHACPDCGEAACQLMSGCQHECHGMIVNL